MKEIDKNKQIEIEAAAFRRLVEHLRAHTEVQNILFQLLLPMKLDTKF